eukprot:15367212-Ditylum_brightwellii.AAC.1
MKQSGTLADDDSMCFVAMVLVFISSTQDQHSTATMSGHFVNLAELRFHCPYLQLPVVRILWSFLLQMRGNDSLNDPTSLVAALSFLNRKVLPNTLLSLKATSTLKIYRTMIWKIATAFSQHWPSTNTFDHAMDLMDNNAAQLEDSMQRMWGDSMRALTNKGGEQYAIGTTCGVS